MVCGLVTFKQSESECNLYSSGASGDVQYGRYAALLSLKGNAAQGEF